MNQLNLKNWLIAVPYLNKEIPFKIFSNSWHHCYKLNIKYRNKLYKTVSYYKKVLTIYKLALQYF